MNLVVPFQYILGNKVTAVHNRETGKVLVITKEKGKTTIEVKENCETFLFDNEDSDIFILAYVFNLIEKIVPTDGWIAIGDFFTSKVTRNEEGVSMHKFAIIDKL